MIFTLDPETKRNIGVFVKIHLEYDDDPGVHDRFNKLKAEFNDTDVSVDIKIGKGRWCSNCLIMNAHGTVSLEKAEKIVSDSFDNYILPTTLSYEIGRGFVLGTR